MGLWQVFSLSFFKGCGGDDPEPAPPAQPTQKPSNQQPTAYTLNDSDTFKYLVWNRDMTVVCPENRHCLFRVGKEVKAVNAGDPNRQFQLQAGTSLRPLGVRQPPPEYHKVRKKIPAEVVDSLRGAPIRGFMDAHGMEKWGATNPNRSISADKRSFRLTFLPNDHDTLSEREAPSRAFGKGSFVSDFEEMINKKLRELGHGDLQAVVFRVPGPGPTIEVSLVPRNWKQKEASP